MLDSETADEWIVPDQESLHQITLAVDSDLAQGVDKKSIVEGLVGHDGWPKEAAVSFVDQVERERGEHWRQQWEKAKRSTIAYDFIIGGGVFILAGLASLVSYYGSAPGETYIIWVGGMVAGGIGLLRGIIRLALLFLRPT